MKLIIKSVTLLMLLLSFGQFISCGQEKKIDKKILGKWEGVRRETIAGRKTLNNGQLMKEAAIYDFKSDGSVVAMIVPPGEVVPYSIKEDILTIGTLQYIIEKLDKNEMILLDYKEGNRRYPLAFRRYFKKAKT